ncbi:MAG: ligase 1 [Sphingomonadales bacterium]|jgi:ATP-dependent DNA ligase|nr:ligase 1 [Sphingomonadales bacterium]
MNALGPHPALLRRNDPGPELCQLVGDWRGKMPAGGAIVEPKLDGIRALWIDGELVTREGTPIAGAEHIDARLRWLEREACVPLFFDGEFLVGGTFAETLAHFQARGGNGVAGTLHLFEGITMRTWRGEDPCETLEARRIKLDAMLAGKADAAVRPMPWSWANDADEVAAKAREFIAAGGEGVVVKDPLGTYQRRRSTEWQRIKKAMTLDLVIVDAVPQADRAWMLGALVLDYRGRRVRVSAGFSDAERMALWRDRAQLVGTVAEISAMEVTEAGSLRQARFVRLRPDKGGVR